MMVGSQGSDFARGLEGVVAAETKIGFVDGINGRLVYRGYNIETLVKNSSFEEVSYLLLYGKLPTKTEYRDFLARINKEVELPEGLVDIINRTTKNSHPMSALRTAVSYIGALDPLSEKPDLESQEEMGIRILAKFPNIIGAINCALEGRKFRHSTSESYEDRFLESALGKKPSDIQKKVMNAALILHADHGMNASTFASMVTISTLSDMYSAVTSAISSLKGPLHGGANERALELLEKIGTPDNADERIEKMIQKKEKIMGFGHRVYKVYDPRARILKEYARDLSKATGHERTFWTAEEVEKVMVEKLGEKGIFPNVDFYSGIVYDALGFKKPIFTPIFALSRISGWLARSLEYLHDNRLFRPRSTYHGEIGPLDYVPMDLRSDR